MLASLTLIVARGGQNAQHSQPVAELSLSREGYCEATKEGEAGHCLTGSKGSSPLPKHHRASWEAAMRYCASRCASCKQCNYISVSIEWADCSWYSSCDLEKLHNTPTGFKSAPAKLAKQLRRFGAAQTASEARAFDKLHKEQGYCAVVDLNQPGDCRKDSQGFFDVVPLGLFDVHSCVAHCLSQCERCNYVSWSISLTTHECRWYSLCPRVRWANVQRQFTTVQVRAPDAPAVALPPPPPPPALAVPAGSQPGYCSLMDPAYGSCELDEQGSFSDANTPEKCFARCGSCANCHYVSVSLAGNDSATFYREARLSGSGSAARHRRRRAEQPAPTHAPHWWRCRWYRICNMDDLRQTADVEGYVTIPVKPGPVAAMILSLESAAPTTASSMPSSAAAREAAREAASQASHALAVAAATHAAERLAQRQAHPLLGIVTVAARARHLKFGYDVRCALAQWCLSALRLEAALPTWRVRRLVLVPRGQSTEWMNSSAGCTLEPVLPDPRLGRAAVECSERVAAGSYAHMASLNRQSGYVHDSAYFKEVNMLKWQLFALWRFDVLLFADADLEVVPYAEAPHSMAARAWSRALARLQASTALLVADPDGLAPLNTGFMLLKPSASLFEEGLQVLERCVYNRTLGWDHVGRPSTLGVKPLQLPSLKLVDSADPVATTAAEYGQNMMRLRRTRAYAGDSWDFTSSDCDQGLFFYMLYVKHRKGAFGRPGRLPVVEGRHWWASYKPWRVWPLLDSGKLASQSEMAKRIHGHDPTDLARLYAYIVRLEAPATLSPPEEALLRSSDCWQSQYNLRRAVERQYTHFWELEEIWRGELYAGPGWNELPSRR